MMREMWCHLDGIKPVSDGISAKWGTAVAERGFTQIPNYLLMINQFLDDEFKLTPVEQLVLFQLVGSWWNKKNLPFPSMRTLAGKIGASERQVQRAVNALEKKNLLKRIRRVRKGVIASNAYDLSGLVNLLEEISKIFPNQHPRLIKINEIKTNIVDNVIYESGNEEDKLEEEDKLAIEDLW